MLQEIVNTPFVVCRYCEKAHMPDKVSDRFTCPHCRREWMAPHRELASAYRASFQELEVCMVAPDGERFAVASFPVELGRNSSFLALQRNLSVSRRHCIVDYDGSCGAFKLTALHAAGGCFLNGVRLTEGSTHVFRMSDTFSLSGVVLRLEGCLKKTSALLVSDSVVNCPPVILPDAPLSFLNISQEGELHATTVYSPASIAAIRQIDGKKRSVLALKRLSVHLNGECFVERTLEDGDCLNCGGCLCNYVAEGGQLLPASEVKGEEIRVENVTAGYDGNVVLNDINCYIPSGSLTAILGQSGCGKSTLVKILSGLKLPEQGKVIVSGTDEEYISWSGQHQALVPQFNIAHEELTVWQCVDYAAALRLKNVSAVERFGLVSRALKETGLSQLGNTRVGNLSGGQLKRVNIAVETVGRPQFLILDEPTTGLDYATEKQIIAVLRQMSRQGRTVLFVTHSLAALETVDHVIVLQKGSHGACVAAEGRPAVVQQAIGVENWEELFLSMEENVKDTVPPAGRRGGGAFAGFPALLMRYVHQWLSSPIASVCMFFGLPLLLGMLISAAVAYDHKDTLLFALVAMFWLGMNQTVREIVREKELFLHEHARCVGSVSYLASKCLFFAAVSLPQAMLLMLPISTLHFNGVDGILMPGRLECGGALLPMLWLAGMVGCSLGLATSAFVLFLRSKGEVAAVLIAVLFTLPQILFSTKVIPDGLVKSACPEQYYSMVIWHADSAPVAELCSFFTFSRYLYLPLEALHNNLPPEVVAQSFSFNVGVLVMSLACLVFLAYVLLEIHAYLARR